MTLSDNFVRRAAHRHFAVIFSLVAIGGFGAIAARPIYAQDANDAQKLASGAIEGPGYTRALKDADGQITAVQTAIRRFTPAKSDQPTVYLVAVTHIGEKSYYAQIQQLLDKQDLVLFEGVRPSKDESKKTIAEQKADSEKAHTTQKRLSDALGVQFQLDGINYRHATFHDSDLSWDELVTAAKQSGAGSEAQLKALRAMLSGGGPEAGITGAMLNNVLSMVEKQPAVAQVFRTVLLKALSDPDALAKMQAQVAAPKTAGAKTAPPSDLMETVLIEARNKAVLHDLKADSTALKPGASVALFYGAGHMKDMEHRLETEGYRPADVQWLTALTAKPAGAGAISASANSPSAATP